MIQRDGKYIDSTGRVVLSNSEECIHCNKPSKEGHPAGVVPGVWRCTGCGQWQNELSNHLEDE